MDVTITQSGVYSYSAAQGMYYNLTVSHGSFSDSRLISLNESTYHFTASEGARPCEVYNFSITLAHANNVDVRTGCSVLLETILYSRNPLDTDYDLWTEVDLLGELIVKVGIGLHIIIILLAGSLYFNNIIHSGAVAEIFSSLLSFFNLAAAKDQWHWIVAVIIVIVLRFFAIILISILGVGTARKIRYINFNDYHLILCSINYY